MFKGLLRTNGIAADLKLRFALGAVFFPHGAQKVLGIWGGHGLVATMGFFTRKMECPRRPASRVARPPCPDTPPGGPAPTLPLPRRHRYAV